MNATEWASLAHSVLNTYAYVSGAPLRITDVWGLESDDGPQSCLYYDEQCKKSGICPSSDTYACSARKCCESFGDNPSSNCTRRCLIDFDRVNCSKYSGELRNQCRLDAHVRCYATCLDIANVLRTPWRRSECQAALRSLGASPSFGGLGPPLPNAATFGRMW